MRASAAFETAGSVVSSGQRSNGSFRSSIVDSLSRFFSRLLPVFSRSVIICTGETYKNVVKMTFAKGAALQDPSGLFNSSLDGNVRRAIDIHEGDKVDEAALKDLIRAAVALNLERLNLNGKGKPKPPRASSNRAD